jgi:hypothetical protein
MDLKSRGEKISIRHLAPDNLKSLRLSLSQQLEIVKLENGLECSKPDNFQDSKNTVIPKFSSLPYRPRTQ